MGSLPCLELMRVACNRLAAVPDSFAGLDALAWFSLGGNPACAPAPPARCRVLCTIPFLTCRVVASVYDISEQLTSRSALGWHSSHLRSLPARPAVNSSSFVPCIIAG